MRYGTFGLIILGSFLVALALQAALVRAGAWFRSAERKAGTYRAASGQGASSKLPMTGGVAMLLAALIGGSAVVLTFHTWPGAWRVAVGIVLFGLVGLMDDVGKYRGRGLPHKVKTIGCLVASGVTAALLVNHPVAMWTWPIALHWVAETAYLFCFAVAADFSDGIDGLVGGIGLIAAFAMLVAAYLAARDGAGMWALAFVVILAFLLFNLPSAWTSRGTAKRRARVYLGDSGALAMGGGLAAAALWMHLGWIFIPAAAVWVIEGFSSGWQAEFLVKRLYRRWGRVERYGAARAPHTEFPLPLLAAPIHHHFELAGWDRLQTVKLFYLAALLCGIGAVVAALSGLWMIAGFGIAAATIAALWSLAGLYRTCYLAVGDGGHLALNSGLPFHLRGWRYHKTVLKTEAEAAGLTADERLWLYRPLPRSDAMELLVRLLMAHGRGEEAAMVAASLPAGMREMRLSDVLPAEVPS
jgi:phospho-N-acetylmuramoyl-pentapeptide-transferase